MMRLFSFFCGHRPPKHTTPGKVFQYLTQFDNPVILGAYLASKGDLGSDPKGSYYLKLAVGLGEKGIKHSSILLHHGANPCTKSVYTMAMPGSSHDVVALLLSYGMPYKKQIIKPSFSDGFKARINWCNLNYKAFRHLSKCFKSLNQQLESGEYEQAKAAYYEVEQLIDALPEEVSRDIYSYARNQYSLKLQELQIVQNTPEERGSEYQKLL